MSGEVWRGHVGRDCCEVHSEGGDPIALHSGAWGCPCLHRSGHGSPRVPKPAVQERHPAAGQVRREQHVRHGLHARQARQQVQHVAPLHPQPTAAEHQAHGVGQRTSQSGGLAKLRTTQASRRCCCC